MNTTMDIQVFSFKGLIKIFLAFMIASVLLIGCYQIVYGQHAIDRHGSTAEAVRQCLTNNNPVVKLHNPTTGRDASICQISTGLFGIMITEGEKEITSFEKEKMNTIDKVIRYLNNAGYFQ